MNIEIIGVGKLGSTIAYSLLSLKPEKLRLLDIRELSGEILDLQHAAKGLGLDTIITTETLDRVDYVIITAGKPRLTETDDLSDNFDTIKNIITDLNERINKNTQTIVMTNPVEKMTEYVKFLMHGYLNGSSQISNPESILMDMRDGKELGWDIVKSKGYSNWGPAVSCLKLVEKLNNAKNKDYHA